MALFGVVFAVGAGSASAQLTISVPKTVDEGEGFVVEFVLKYIKAPGSPQSILALTARADQSTSPNTSTIGRIDGLTAGERDDFIYPGEFRWEPNVPANSGTEPVTGTVRTRFTVHTVSDVDAEDEEIRIRRELTVNNLVGLTGQDGRGFQMGLTNFPDELIRIEDNEEQTFEWGETPTGDANTSPTEGTATTRTLRADPVPDDMVWSIPLSVSETGYTFDAGTASLTNSLNGSYSITITPPDVDGNREDDTIELSAFLPGTNELLPGIEPLEITFADVHALPEAGRITAQAYEDEAGAATGITTTETDAVTEGGDPVHVRVTIDRGDDGYPLGEKLVVTPRYAAPAQAADVRIEPASVEIAAQAGKPFADFLLYARADDDVGAETLELELVTKGEKPANGPGEVVGTFSIDIVDATRALVAAKPPAAAEAVVMREMGAGPLNPGASFTLDVNELFDWSPAAVDVVFAASVSGAAASASVSGETVTVRAEEAGDATVTVTATATARGSSAVSTRQAAANSASVTFDVQVVLADLAIVLSGPADMNVVEGGQPAVVTAKANRAVTKDTTVRLVATGGDAAPGDYAVEDVTIAAGADEGAAMLTATPDAEGERSETLTLQGQFVDDESGKDKETNALTFTLWDAAVPALPVVAQLLLAAFLAVGGYRRYRRRR